MKKEIETVKLNLNDVQIKDLNDNRLVVDDFCKQIGNQIFTAAPTLEIFDASRKIHAGEEVVLNEQELTAIIEIVNNKPYYIPLAHVPLMNYLNNLLNTFNTKKNEN